MSEASISLITLLSSSIIDGQINCSHCNRDGIGFFSFNAPRFPRLVHNICSLNCLENYLTSSNIYLLKPVERTYFTNLKKLFSFALPIVENKSVRYSEFIYWIQDIHHICGKEMNKKIGEVLEFIVNIELSREKQELIEVYFINICASIIRENYDNILVEKILNVLSRIYCFYCSDEENLIANELRELARNDIFASIITRKFLENSVYNRFVPLKDNINGNDIRKIIVNILNRKNVDFKGLSFLYIFSEKIVFSGYIDKFIKKYFCFDLSKTILLNICEYNPNIIDKICNTILKIYGKDCSKTYEIVEFLIDMKDRFNPTFMVDKEWLNFVWRYWKINDWNYPIIIDFLLRLKNLENENPYSHIFDSGILCEIIAKISNNNHTILRDFLCFLKPYETNVGVLEILDHMKHNFYDNFQLKIVGRTVNWNKYVKIRKIINFMESS